MKIRTTSRIKGEKLQFPSLYVQLKTFSSYLDYETLVSAFTLQWYADIERIIDISDKTYNRRFER